MVIRAARKLFAKRLGPNQGPKTDRSEDAEDARIFSLQQMPAALYAVGDIHGCYDLYRQLENQIIADGQHYEGQKLIVILGDMVDRGPQSASLIDHLIAPAPAGFQRLVLRGNHEQLFLDFVKDPRKHRKWLDFGGTDTLLSYNIRPDEKLSFDLPPAQLSKKLHSSIPQTHLDFLAKSPFGLRVGEYFLCHAGIDPQRGLTAQFPEDLLWGDPSRVDGYADLPTIVHGHVALDAPLITKPRINLDTGAYATGCLTAVRLQHAQQPSILQCRK